MHLAIVLDDELAAAPIGDAHAHTGVFHGAGDAHGVAAANGLVIGGLYGLQRLHQARGLIHDLAVGQNAAGADGIAITDLPGADAHQIRHLVEQRLRAEAGLGHAKAPEGPGGRIVGVIRAALDLEVFIGIGPRRMGAGPLQHRPSQRGKGTGVGHHAGLDPLNDAVFIAAHGEVHVEAVALGVDQDGFLPGQLHLHRHPGDIRQQGGVVLDGHILLAAEAAAHQHILDLAVVIVHPQHGGALVHGGVRALVRGQQADAAVFQGQSNAALRLQEGVLGPGGVEVLGQHIFCILDSAVCVAPGDVLIGLNVALVPLEHQGRVRGGSLLGTVHGREDLIFYLHQLLGGLQGLLLPGADQGHGVPQIVGDLAHADQGGLVLLQVAHVDLAGDVLLGQNAHHAGQGLRLAGVDGQDPGPGVLAAHCAAVAHPVHIHIIRILAIAQDLFLHVQPVDAAAHFPVVGRGRRQLPLPEDLTGQQDTVDDLHIAGAAADVVADGEGGLLSGGIGIHVQQPLGGDDHAGDAEAALNGSRLAEGEGIHLLFPIGKALHREDGLALQLVGLGDAGLGGLAVDEDVAGAAGALAAPVLNGGQVQGIPQKADELLIFFHGHALPVNGEGCHVIVSFVPARRHAGA